MRGSEDMCDTHERCSGVCCGPTACIPNFMSETESAVNDSDLLVADLKQQLDFANKEIDKLQSYLERTARDLIAWQGTCRRYADISFDRLKIIGELDRKLRESRWTKFVRWFKNEWDYDIYA